MGEQDDQEGRQQETRTPLYVYRSEDAPREALTLLTPQTPKAREIFDDLKKKPSQRLCWAHRVLGYQAALVQAHLALVEKAFKGEVGEEERKAYIGVLDWVVSLAGKRESRLMPVEPTRILPLLGGEEKEQMEQEIANIRTLDTQTEDGMEELLSASRGHVVGLMEARVLRPIHGTLAEIEKKIQKEVRQEKLTEALFASVSERSSPS